MSDRKKSNPPTVPIPPELQGREPDPPTASTTTPADPGEQQTRSDPEDVVLRRTFAVQVLPADARALEAGAARVVEAVRESHEHFVTYTVAIGAAADDLLSLAEYLDLYCDNRGDGVERHELKLAAAALDAVDVVARVGRELKAETIRAAAAGVAP
jgi:hypothetical protein